MTKHISIGLIIKQIHDSLEKRANNDLKDKDLTMMQMSILIALINADKEFLSMKELEQHFNVAQSTVVGIISRLKQKRLVEILSDAKDKRVKLVHITAAGKVCCKDAGSHMDKVEKLLLKNLSDEEQNILNSLLIRVLDNLK